MKLRLLKNQRNLLFWEKRDWLFGWTYYRGVYDTVEEAEEDLKSYQEFISVPVEKKIIKEITV